ncbi:hypothetical protein IHC92_18300 [Photobacterium damselae subsp. damselae]|uniref:hypothetical protein n=1 Tax=Photobacterium damselae TaxID=38293 RepID=UPI001F281609|nr:hypothetical protein [Photobacterium damselae]UJZ95408.1 hypothetical protein IHC87_18310 [Photobacterium damselae subsp. damselae]UJZ99577.1 hypothetical protein IHC88_19180 [Photobacterium damselae subsp. damselae]UKA08684.1 hypothetical protein IHC90_16885 [Photobacterium damselae subsp. damselae]UKA11730.1 hypothetical protein IHC91_18275 [Photobacterium damselae subsp. damselae]UKA22922.1 hypothetical protein IHC92_18300 [Photobacterium damselae subsp. damselae]
MENKEKSINLMYAACTVALIWFAAGSITIGSVYIDMDTLSINIIIGSFFQLLSILFLIKEYHFYRFMTDKSKQFDFNERKVKRVLYWEFFLVICIGLLGIIVLSGIYFRVFGEGFSVFG